MTGSSSNQVIFESNFHTVYNNTSIELIFNVVFVLLRCLVMSIRIETSYEGGSNDHFEKDPKIRIE